MIAMNLTVNRMFDFQDSSVSVLAATSDVSFYSQYSNLNYPNNEIKLLYYNRDWIPNWESIVELFFKDNYKFAAFFYSNACKMYGPSSCVARPVIGSELERIGFKLGDIFATATHELYNDDFGLSETSVEESVTELKEKYPELAITEQWNCFEDFLYAHFHKFICDGIKDINTPEGAEFWQDVMKFAEQKNYLALQNKFADKIMNNVFYLVAEGLIKYEEGLEHLRSQIQKLRDLTDTQLLGRHISLASVDTLPGLARLYDYLLKELIGKRRQNYAPFFGGFIREMIGGLFNTILDRNNLEQHLAVLKSCLRWRFFISDDHWRTEKLDLFTQRLCIYDEEIRRIFFPNGLVLDDKSIKNLTDRLNEDCTVEFRQACERFLFYSENVDEKNELVFKAREACRRNFKRKSEGTL